LYYTPVTVPANVADSYKGGLTVGRQHYSNAPITEAVIDLRVIQPEELSVTDLEVLREKLADSYPVVDEEHRYSGGFSIEGAGDSMQTGATQWRNGFRFTSRDKQQVFHAQLDGFAFSVRAPYDRWETFRDEARRLWDLYRSVTKVEGVIRAEVRYVNQLDLAAYASDSSRIEFGDFLKVYPELPRDWPGGDRIDGFFMQLQLRQEDLGCWLILNEAPAWSPGQENYVLQLDLDFFREQPEAPWRVDDDVEIWRYLEQLHVRKNEVFEASITEATRRFLR
jgi:uncharacterized protein (TIGR04255 family)